MAYLKVNSPEHLNDKESFFLRHPSKSHSNVFFLLFKKIFFLFISLRKIKFKPLGTFSVAHRMPKVFFFFKIFKIKNFCFFITQLMKKLQLWSLFGEINDILPFVLNTNPPLWDIWLLRYLVNNFIYL